MPGYDGKHAATPLEELNSPKSGYSWSGNPQYTSSIPSRSSIDLMYAQRDLGDSSRQTSTSYHRNSDPTSYGSASSYRQRGSFESQTTLSEYPVRQPPEIKSFNPSCGTSGSPIHVFLRSEYDLLAPPALILSMTFATKRTMVDVTRLETTGASFEYAILATAPPYSETGSTTSQVQVRLQLQEESGHDAGAVDIGRFEYVAGQLQESPQVSARKRKLSDELGNHQTPYSSYPFTSANPSAYPQSLHSVDLSTMQRRFTPYGRAQHQQRLRDPNSMPATLPSQSFMQPPVSQASQWSPSFTTLSGRGTMHADGQTVSLSSSDATPVLVRTTTLQQNGSPGSTPGAGGNAFNPYMYPQKAVLRIHGELNSMTEDWTTDEWAAKRRLVQFTRSQQKSTINADFAPVTPEERQPSSICVSCIWWEERDECFVTSVDTIQLLEQLVALRFTVEEKNRIRRNLEGFHPETVSKGKADSEEFFKIIMGFPNPKPRNIEKDVKVFPWKILSHALKKIISKYSASYSSTAGSLGSSRNSVSYHYDSPGYHGMSSRSGSESGIYPSTLKSNAPSPHSVHSNYSDTPLSGSLPPISSEYLSSQYNDQNAFLQQSYSAPTNHHRSGSAGDYEVQRPYKRPRANTSNAAYCSPHAAASMLTEMTRSYSDHGSGSRLPSLHEPSSYLPSSDQRFGAHGQVTAGMSHSQMGGRGSYDFGAYLNDASATEAEQQHAVDAVAQAERVQEIA